MYHFLLRLGIAIVPKEIKNAASILNYNLIFHNNILLFDYCAVMAGSHTTSFPPNKNIQDSHRPQTNKTVINSIYTET
jgi:hypothetical protein